MAWKLPHFPVESRAGLWPIAALLLTALFLARSVVNIAPGEAAVRINNITGDETAVTTPGWTVRLPFMHSLYVLDAAPQTFSMKGDTEQNQLLVPKLTVRASDGSNFHFDDTTVIFQLKIVKPSPPYATVVRTTAGKIGCARTSARSCATSSAASPPSPCRTPRPTRRPRTAHASA